MSGSSPTTRKVRATYRGGLITPDAPLDLPDGTSVEVRVPSGSQPLATSGILREVSRTDLIVLLSLLLFYAFTRLLGLTAFPIYFFCDEAIQANLARDLLANGLRDADGHLFPPYFYNAEKWSLSLSVYIQLLSTALLGGTSVFITRATSVVVSMLAVVAVALALRLVFQSRFWWVGPLMLTIAPTWFLHSRTAFETVMMVAFYASFLACYLLYRTRSPGWLFPALIFGAMTFYSYANGQGLMLASGVLLLLMDLPYHLRQGWRVLSAASGTLVLLVLPLIRFRMLEPDALNEHLRVLDSYWTHSIPLAEKFMRFGQAYLTGLSPFYWFFPNTLDLERHRVLGAGHLPLLLLPFILVGLGVCLINLRSAPHRIILIALLAAPFSSAVAAISVTRVMAMVVPAAILAAIGFDTVYHWIAKYVRYTLVVALVAFTLSTSGLLLLRSALVHGPTWFTNYALSGMQYGAEQLFGETIPALLLREPDVQLLVSPTWANNPNAFLDFFLTRQQVSHIQMINIDAFANTYQPLDPTRQMFVMPAYEYATAIKNNKFVIDVPEQIIPYPDGTPGFYVVRIGYVENVEALFAADRITRATLVETEVNIGGPVLMAHSLLDIGSPAQLFDGDTTTLMRGFEANPLVVELYFPQPRTLSGISLTVGSMDLDLRLSVTPTDGSPPITVQEAYRELPTDPTVDLNLPNPMLINSLRLEITQAGFGEVAHVHVRELALR